MLPYSRNTSYVNGDDPPVDGDDLNDLQDEAVDHEKAIRGGYFQFRDDFDKGSTLDTDVWSFGLTVVDESANDGFGSVHLFSGSPGSNFVVTNQKFPLFVAGRKFREVWRMRAVDVSIAGAYIAVGLNDNAVSLTGFIGFFVKQGSTKWWTSVGSVPSFLATTIDFDPAAYVELELRCDDGANIVMLIDDVEVRGPFAFDTGDPAQYVFMAAVNAPTGGYVDSVNLTARRS